MIPTSKQIIKAMYAQFEEPVDKRQVAEMEKKFRDELGNSEAIVRLRNDGDHQCVICDIRSPQTGRETFSVSWDECVNGEPKPQLTEDTINKLKKPQLIEHLEALELDTDGTVPELKERLIATLDDPLAEPVTHDGVGDVDLPA